MTAADPLLAVEDLHVHFGTYEGTAEVINGVDFTVDAGEKVAIVGETGCGKSVTMRTILGLLSRPPARIPAGSVRFKGRELLDAPETELRAIRGTEISMVMQDPMTSLNPVFTVGEQMLDVLRWQSRPGFSLVSYVRDRLRDESDRRDRAIEMLERVRIAAPERVFSSYPVELSGGMRQRVLIAMSLLAEPDLLIADEPGTALDVTTEKRIRGLIDDLVAETGTSVLYITHDLGVARRMSERISVMYAGEIVEQAPTATLFAAPQHPYTRGLLESIPHLSGRMGTGIPGQLPDYADPPAACRFADRCDHAEPACREVPPHLRRVGDRHAVACHLHDGPPLLERDLEAGLPAVDIGGPPWSTDEQPVEPAREATDE